MDGSVHDALDGKHYDLRILENDIVKVESAGFCIRVGIKNASGIPFSWWEPRYPFHPTPPGVSWPKQNGWVVTIEAPSSELTRAIFEKENERHVLALRITDPTANPKPVEVSWE